MLAKLQAKWRDLHDKERDLARKLEYHYRHWWLAPKGKVDKFRKLLARAEAAMEAIFVWLDANSPRSWRSGVPAYWICNHLTEADALTADRLSVVPPPAYGAYQGEAERFAAPVKPKGNDHGQETENADHLGSPRREEAVPDVGPNGGPGEGGRAA